MVLFINLAGNVLDLSHRMGTGEQGTKQGHTYTGTQAMVESSENEAKFKSEHNQARVKSE